MITIFTPTYNRANLLVRLYKSLCLQKNTDFEWLVVDDGSTDNTSSIIESFKKDRNKGFEIRYIKQINGGKHRAINRGVKEAQGDLFFIVDSDDQLLPDSLNRVQYHYNSIKDRPEYAGVSGIDCFPDGKIVGNGLPNDIIDASSLDIRNKYKVKGDMAEAFKTKVLKEFPFPEIDGEKFCPEALIWNRIAAKYKLRYFNEAIYIAEYQDDGLSSKIVKIRMQSPIASMMCYSELSKLPIPLNQKVKANINYWRFCFCNLNKEYPRISNVWIWTKPIGYLMHLQDRKLIKNT